MRQVFQEFRQASGISLDALWAQTTVKVEEFLDCGFDGFPIDVCGIRSLGYGEATRLGIKNGPDVSGGLLGLLDSIVGLAPGLLFTHVSVADVEFSALRRSAPANGPVTPGPAVLDPEVDARHDFLQTNRGKQ